LKQAIQRQNLLGMMLGASLLLHVAVLLGLKFSPLDPGRLNHLVDKLPPLEVVLVNAKTESEPVQAQVLAQNNLDRGGDTDADKRMKTPLPTQPSLIMALKPAPRQDMENRQASKHSNKIVEEVKHTEQQVKEIEKQVKQVITQLNNKPLEQTSAPPAATEASNVNISQFNARDAVSHALNGEIRHEEAELAREVEEYQKRPVRKVYGVNAKGYRFALYVEAWSQKVENIGSLNFPEEAKTQKIYGSLIMTVSLRADGSIEKLEIGKSSNYKILDDAARRIVELGAPYAAFSADMRSDTDILEITRTWTFTREETLSSK
jgi:protein TonB